MCRLVNVPMKNIGVSKAIWRKLNKVRREQGLKYYNEVIEYLLKRPTAQPQQPATPQIESVSIFEEKKKSYSDGHKKGMDDGYDKAKNDWQIWFFCNTCGERMDIIPNSNVHEDVIEHLRRNRWGHSVCHQRSKEENILPHSE